MDGFGKAVSQLIVCLYQNLSEKLRLADRPFLCVACLGAAVWGLEPHAHLSSHFVGVSLELKQGRFTEWTCVCERKPEKHSEPSAVQQLAVEWVNEKGRKGRLVKVQPADDGWTAHSHCTKQLLLSI